MRTTADKLIMPWIMSVQSTSSESINEPNRSVIEGDILFTIATVVSLNYPRDKLTIRYLNVEVILLKAKLGT